MARWGSAARRSRSSDRSATTSRRSIPRPGKVAWRHAFPGGGGGGLLTTAGEVVFSGDGAGNFAAFDATNGKPLWHSRIGNISNAPQTYSIDGRQHVLVAVGDTLYTFAMY